MAEEQRAADSRPRGTHSPPSHPFLKANEGRALHSYKILIEPFFHMASFRSLLTVPEVCLDFVEPLKLMPGDRTFDRSHGTVFHINLNAIRVDDDDE